MSYADVQYMVPVIARVNVEEGVVERVIICDEETKLDRNDEGFAVIVGGSADGERAAEIAEDPATMWPAWERGT